MKTAVPAWSVVVVVPNGQDILAISRGFNVRDPALPGGDSEDTDEVPAQTAVRELLEETGVTALEARCFDRWIGDRGQPVFAFYIPRWKCKRLRVSSEGKPFWTEPHKLLVKTAYYKDEAKSILEKLSQTTALAKTG
jgi:8-oxo-dGTP pyrophosphatase MutT (NUDIX family)